MTPNILHMIIYIWVYVHVLIILRNSTKNLTHDWRDTKKAPFRMFFGIELEESRTSNFPCKAAIAYTVMAHGIVVCNLINCKSFIVYFLNRPRAALELFGTIQYLCQKLNSKRWSWKLRMTMIHNLQTLFFSKLKFVLSFIYGIVDSIKKKKKG